MKTIEELTALLRQTKGTVLKNYIVPGLESELLATTPAGGKIRRFWMTRPQEFFVTPHDHRFNFDCYVIRGRVTNTIYEVEQVKTVADATHVAMPYRAEARAVDNGTREMVFAVLSARMYGAGDEYSMSADQFHSISFEPGTSVLFVEGPPLKERNRVLMPVVDGVICDTFMWKPWMMEPR